MLPTSLIFVLLAGSPTDVTAAPPAKKAVAVAPKTPAKPALAAKTVPPLSGPPAKKATSKPAPKKRRRSSPARLGPGGRSRRARGPSVVDPGTTSAGQGATGGGASQDGTDDVAVCSDCGGSVDPGLDGLDSGIMAAMDALSASGGKPGFDMLRLDSLAPNISVGCT